MEDKRVIFFLLPPFLNTVCMIIFLPSETKRLNGPVSVKGLLRIYLVLVLYTTVYSKIKVVVKIMITVIIVKSWQSLSI